MNLEDHVAGQVARSRTVSFEGLILDAPFDGIVVVVPCFCVQDTKEHPCDCKGGVRYLIPEDDIVGKPEKLRRTSPDGDPISQITVARDANIVVEQSTPMKAEAALRFLIPPIPPWINIPPWLPPPTWPVPPPDPDDPDVAYIIWGPIIKYGATALIGAGGAIIGGWLSADEKDCVTETTTTVTQNPDGSTTTHTTSVKTCK